MNTAWRSELQDSPVRCSAAPIPFLPAHPCICTQTYPDLTQTSAPQPPTGGYRTHFCPYALTHMLLTYNTCTQTQSQYTCCIHTYPGNNNRLSLYVSLPPTPYTTDGQRTSHSPRVCLHFHRWMPLCTHRPMDVATPHPAPSHCAPIPLRTPSSPPSPFY